MIFENNIHWYMYKYLKINNICFSLLMATSNVPLQIGNFTPRGRGTCTPGWETLV